MPIAYQIAKLNSSSLRNSRRRIFRRALPTLFAIGLAVLVACGGSATPQPFESVPQAISTLDEHILTNEVELFYQLIGALGGFKYDVEPFGYQVEVYVYRNPDEVPGLEELENPSTLSHVVDNALFVLHSTDDEDLKRFVADLSDG